MSMYSSVRAYTIVSLKKLLYTNDEFIDFEMKRVRVEDDNYWRPVYGTNPITNDRCIILAKKRRCS